MFVTMRCETTPVVGWKQCLLFCDSSSDHFQIWNLWKFEGFFFLLLIYLPLWSKWLCGTFNTGLLCFCWCVNRHRVCFPTCQLHVCVCMRARVRICASKHQHLFNISRCYQWLTVKTVESKETFNHFSPPLPRFLSLSQPLSWSVSRPGAFHFIRITSLAVRQRTGTRPVRPTAHEVWGWSVTSWPQPNSFKALPLSLPLFNYTWSPWRAEQITLLLKMICWPQLFMLAGQFEWPAAYLFPVFFISLFYL